MGERVETPHPKPHRREAAGVRCVPRGFQPTHETEAAHEDSHGGKTVPLQPVRSELRQLQQPEEAHAEKAHLRQAPPLRRVRRAVLHQRGPEATQAGAHGPETFPVQRVPFVVQRHGKAQRSRESSHWGKALPLQGLWGVLPKHQGFERARHEEAQLGEGLSLWSV